MSLLTLASRLAPARSARPLILTGHQPGFEHPGVWLKNFAACALAERMAGLRFTWLSTAMRAARRRSLVPAGSIEAPRLAPVQFDQATGPTPWEERGILDADVWRTFPDRVRATAAPLVRDPMLNEWWPTVVARGAASGRLGAGLAQAGISPKS